MSYNEMSGATLMAHARHKLLRKAKHDIRFGKDLTREVKMWPRMQTEEMISDSEAQSEMLTGGAKKVGGWSGFVRETFGRLYTGDRTRELDEVSPEHQWAKTLHNSLDDLPEWRDMVQRCKGDSYATSAMTLGLGRKFSEQVPQHHSNADDAKAMYEYLLEQFEQDQQDAIEQGETPPSEPQKLTDAREQYEKAAQEAANCAGNMDPSQVRQSARSAMSDVNEHLDEVDRTLSAVGWGSQNAGPGAMSAAAVKQAVADRLRAQTRIKQIMDLAGRLKNVMRQCQAAKVRHGCSEVTDIEKGSEVARMLPSESTLMRHPKGKLFLFRKLLERSTLQYKLEGKEPTGKGPVIVCVDDSSSMDSSREVWSKAVALALLEMARMQKRGFAYCLYSSRLGTQYVEKKGDGVRVGDLLDALTSHRGGGTNFDAPLDWALTQVEKHDRLKDADIIFISDGECQARQIDSHKKRLKKTGARVHGIALGPTAVNAKGPGTMVDFCETVYPISELRLDKSTDEQDSATNAVLSL